VSAVIAEPSQTGGHECICPTARKRSLPRATDTVGIHLTAHPPSLRQAGPGAVVEVDGFTISLEVDANLVIAVDVEDVAAPSVAFLK